MTVLDGLKLAETSLQIRDFDINNGRLFILSSQAITNLDIRGTFSGIDKAYVLIDYSKISVYSRYPVYDFLIVLGNDQKVDMWIFRPFLISQNISSSDLPPDSVLHGLQVSS